MNLKQLWSIIRGRRTNFSWMNASWTYYPDGDPLGKILIAKTVGGDQVADSRGECTMKGPAVPVMGIWLRREGDDVIVYVEKEDGKRYEAIREHVHGPFSHHISEHGLAGLHKLDRI